MKTHHLFKNALCATLAMFAFSSAFAKDKKDDDKRPSKGKGDSSKASKGGSSGERPSGGPSGGSSAGRPSGGPSGGSSSGRPSGGSSGSSSAGRPSGGSSGGPSGSSFRGGPSLGGSSSSARQAPSRGGSPFAQRSTPRPSVRPHVIEPSRRPSFFFDIRPALRPDYYGLEYRTSIGVTGAHVQRALAERGFYYGPIDGIVGPTTRRAIAAFQAEVGLPPTSEITTSLLRALQL